MCLRFLRLIVCATLAFWALPILASNLSPNVVLIITDDMGFSDFGCYGGENDNGAGPNDRVRRGSFGEPVTTWNVGVGWAHASNTPLKYYKRTQHSGGVTTPFIASWPEGIKAKTEFIDQPLHITDILPTLMELTGSEYPQTFGGKRQPPLPGRSFAKVLTDGELLPPKTLYFSLFNNMAIVDGGWRMVTAYDQPWQLYDLTNDRTETRDLAQANPGRLQEMLALQKAYSQRPDARLRLKGGEREPEYAPIYKADGKIGPGANENIPDEKGAMARVNERAQGIQLPLMFLPSGSGK